MPEPTPLGEGFLIYRVMEEKLINTIVEYLKEKGYKVEAPDVDVNYSNKDSALHVLEKFDMRQMAINALIIGIRKRHGVYISQISIKEFVDLYYTDFIEYNGRRYNDWIKFRQFGTKSHNQLKDIINKINATSN